MAERALIFWGFAVKYLLREEDDFVILNGFLSELMGRKIEVSDIIDIDGSESDPENEVTRVDIKARIDGGEFAVFEMRFLQEFDFFDNVLCGVSRALVEYVSTGKLDDIKKIYSINIFYDNLNAEREYLFFGKDGEFRGVHFIDESISFDRTVAKISKNLVGVSQEYYMILPEMFDGTIRDRFDEWVFILKNWKADDKFTAAGIKEAMVKLDRWSMLPEENGRYERYMEKRRSRNSMIAAVKMDARKRGIDETEARRIAVVEKAALNMFYEGFSIAEIVRATMLQEHDVEEVLSPVYRFGSYLSRRRDGDKYAKEMERKTDKIGFTAAGIKEYIVKYDLKNLSPEENRRYELYVESFRGLTGVLLEAKVGYGSMSSDEIKAIRISVLKEIILNMQQEGFSVADVTTVAKLLEDEVKETLD